jgi:DNA-binding CsgD family transcriptional regulator
MRLSAPLHPRVRSPYVLHAWQPHPRWRILRKDHQRIVAASSQAAFAVALLWNQLSARETQIAGEVARGSLSKEIGRGLGIGLWTVDIHRNRIMRKLNVRRTRGRWAFVGDYAYQAEPVF